MVHTLFSSNKVSLTIADFVLYPDEYPDEIFCKIFLEIINLQLNHNQYIPKHKKTGNFDKV